MSNSISMNTDDLNKLNEKLAILDAKNANDALFNSLRKGANVLSKATKQSLIFKMGNSATRPVRKPKNKGNGTYKPLVDNIHVNGERPLCEVKVTILNNGGYLHWFESGTDIRKTSNGYNRGSIEAINFFKDTRQSSFSQMESAIINGLDKEINKRLNRQ